MQSKTRSLEAILRFRMAAERMQWLRLQGLNAQIEKIVQGIAALERSRVDMKLAMFRVLEKGMSGRELGQWSTAAIERAIEAQAELLGQLRQEFEREREVYLARRQERETVESAIARLQAEIAKEADRKEQMRVDDDTLQRRMYSGRKSHFTS